MFCDIKCDSKAFRRSCRGNVSIILIRLQVSIQLVCNLEWEGGLAIQAVF